MMNLFFGLFVVSGFAFVCVSAKSLVDDENINEIKDPRRQPRQVNYRQNPDGSLTATFAAANSFNTPFGSQSFGVGETINIGPNGFSSNGGKSFSSNIMGNNVAFSQANSQNSQFGPYGFGNQFG